MQRFNEKTAATALQEPPDGLLRESFASAECLANDKALRNPFFDRRGRRASMRSFLDTVGLPFDLILEELKEKGLAFYVLGFIRAALRSKNFTPKRLKVLFENHCPADNVDDYLKKVDLAIERVVKEIQK